MAFTGTPSDLAVRTAQRWAFVVPAERLADGDLFVAVAIAVHSLPAADRLAWQTKLAGTEGKPAGAWALLQSLLDGDLSGALTLGVYFDLAPLEWTELAGRVDELRARRPDLLGTAHLGAALWVEALIAVREDNARLGAAVARLQAVPDEARQALVKGAVVLLDCAVEVERSGKRPEPNSPEAHALWQVAPFVRQFRRAAWNRQVTDPLLLSLFAHFPGSLTDHLSDANLLLSAGHQEPAAAIARRLLTDYADSPSVILQASGVLNGAGHGDEVSKLCREAAEKRPYPARRAFRVAWYRQLLRESYVPGRGMPKEPTPFDREREARVAAADSGELEPAFALADLRYVFSALDRQTGLAVDGYRRVVGEAEDPGMRWSAWLAWAAIDPKAAWAKRDGLTGSGAAPEGLAEGKLLVALAAREVKAAADWLAEQPVTDGPDAAARVALAAALKATDDPDGALALLRPWLDETHSRQMLAALRQVTVGGAQFGGPAIPAELRGLADAGLQAMLTPERLWLLTARYATEAVGDIKLGQWLTVLWSGVMAMPCATPTAEQAKVRDTCTAACVDWMKAHPKELTAVRGSLQVAASALNKNTRDFVLPAAEALLTASLRLAKERQLRPEDLRYPLNLLWQQLGACQAPTEVLDRVKAVVKECYPELAPPG